MARRNSGRRDLYKVLGVARDADDATLRKTYRKLARQFHPDLNPSDPDAERRFKETSEAYAVLSDPDKRRNYDEFGEISLDAGFDAEAAREAREAFGARFGHPRAGGSGEEFSFGGLDELFEQIFSRTGRARDRARRRGAHLEAEITLDFLDAARGGKHRITLARPAADGSVKQQVLSVQIPPGVADGGRIRLAGKGAKSPSGGKAGDLYLTVRVRPHRVFRREGRDVHLEVPISVHEAVAGAQVEVPTLDGRATVRVPPATDGGRKLRLRGKGIPDPAGGAAGDLIVTVQIRVPRDLDDAAVDQLASLSKLDPRDLRKDLFQ